MSVEARTKLVVLANFQRWFLRTFILYNFIFLIVFGLGLFLWFKLIVDELINLAGLLSPTFQTAIQRHILLGIFVLLGFLGAILAVAALQALFFSRKIAGPIFALARHLEKCEETGKLTPIRLRKGDLFSELGDQINRLSEKLGHSGK